MIRSNVSSLSYFFLLMGLILACQGNTWMRAQEQATKPNSVASHCVSPSTSDELKALFRYQGDELPLVSGHRGGARRGFPENCIETCEDALRYGYSMFEIDPRWTKDNQVVLHHDATLERTTSGQGRVVEHTLEQLQQLRLKDSFGELTEFRIPTLDAMLSWARGKTILVLDQKDVSTEDRLKLVEKHNAESYTVLIVGRFAEVKACYERNPNVVMEVFIGDHSKCDEFERLGVPWENIIAFVGHTAPTDESLYRRIHAHGAICIVGTSRNLDRVILDAGLADIKTKESEYQAILKRGADILETDIPTLLAPGLYKNATPSPAKAAYFKLH